MVWPILANPFLASPFWCCVVVWCCVMLCVVVCCCVLLLLCAGASHNSQRTPNAHIWGSRPSKTPPKFNEKTPRERQNERKWGREREKRATFWAPHPSGPTLRCPTLRGPDFRAPTLSRFVPPPFEPPTLRFEASTLRGLTVRGPPSADTLAYSDRSIWPKAVLAKSGTGQNRLNGLA